ncbi:MAG: alkaline phosphatase (plasmid) [Candidatus Megaira endosymbiont of Mesostigma viride]|nr:MAG: alkaline phosphatase [Candidatus Megaira endosymbiont of Mesostigma viride]HJK89053.1 ATP-binding protein [Candidatus Megaira endosymbiont of Mesostigma viride]
MQFNIDTVVFIVFLTLNLVVGLYYGRGVKNIKDYSLGNRNFSTGALVSTIVATWIGGDYLFITIAEVYTTGLHYAIGCLGMVVCLFLNAYVFVPKMSEFLGSISVASAMGDLYGKHVRLISAIGGAIASAGFIAVQFKVFGYILNDFLGLSGNYPIFLAASVVILYSSVGGIRSVTFTDVIQFFTFGVLIPVLGIVIWNDLSSLPTFNLVTAVQHPLFNYEEFLGLSNPKFWSVLLLFLLFSIPDLNPTMFQRVAIGRSVSQVKKAFSISAILLMLILIGMAWIAFLLFNIDPNLNPKDLVQYITNNYAHTGLKSFIMVGVVAMCMSTADSNINASSVLLTHDFCYPLNIKFKSELVLSKIISVLLGVISIYLALLDYDLLPLVFMTQSFYIPIIDVPLILAILGFRSTTKSVLIGMGAGFVSVIVWRIYFMDTTGVDSILPGTIVNLIFFMGSHYLLKQNGGWINKKNNQLSCSNGTIGKHKFHQLVKAITEFDLMVFCKNNSPKRDLTYTSFGIFSTISTISTMYSISNVIDGQNKDTILPFYEIMLVLSVCFTTYPIWPSTIKKDNIAQVAWSISIFFLLIFCSSFFLMLSNFSHLQFVVFIVNLIVAAILTRWKLLLTMMIVGIYSSIKAYQYYTGIDNIVINTASTSLIIYTFLLAGTAIVIFFRPKQAYEEEIEQKSNYLEHKVIDQKKELTKLYEIKNELLRNLEHETRTPITGITSLGQVLWDNYDKFNEEQRRNATKDIADSSERLTSLVNNLIDLSKLNNINYQLNKSQVNLTDLVHERLELCKKLYIQDKDDLWFNLQIEDELTVLCDEYYISRTIDNIIVNAIQYCKQGTITIELKPEQSNTILFSVKDEGIGIPKDELFEVFEPFTVSSNTKTPAGGRGIGLALSKKVIEAHNGQIWAKQNQDKGVTVAFTLTIND